MFSAIEATLLLKQCFKIYFKFGWSGGAMVLGTLSVPGRPTKLENSRTRARCACSRCGWGLFGHFCSLTSITSLVESPSLWETTRHRLKCCLKRSLNPKQPTNQPIIFYSPQWVLCRVVAEKRLAVHIHSKDYVLFLYSDYMIRIF